MLAVDRQEVWGRWGFSNKKPEVLPGRAKATLFSLTDSQHCCRASDTSLPQYSKQKHMLFGQPSEIQGCTEDTGREPHTLHRSPPMSTLFTVSAGLFKKVSVCSWKFSDLKCILLPQPPEWLDSTCTHSTWSSSVASKNSSPLGTAPVPGYKDTAALLYSVFIVEYWTHTWWEIDTTLRREWKTEIGNVLAFVGFIIPGYLPLQLFL